MNKQKLKDVGFTFVPFLVSAVCLTFIQAPWKGSFLAWVALVPFVIAALSDRSGWRLVWVSYVVSTCYWLGNLYWIGYVTVPACIMFCMYLGLYWPIMIVCLRFLNAKKFPLILSIPMIVAGAEAWQGILITGFSWRLLGHSQYANLPVIQIADIFGVMAISIIIAAVNGLIAGLVMDYRKGKIKSLVRPSNIICTVIVTALVVATIIYGNFRLGESEGFTEEGPIVGSVQPNVSPAVKEFLDSGEMLLGELVDETEYCFAAGAKFVAWPETMVLTSLNKSYRDLCDEYSRPVVYSRTIGELAKDNGYVMVGAHTAEFERRGSGYELADRYNSAFLYGPDGMQDAKRYDKIHLVPFGEYIPFKESAPWIYKLIMKLTPYDYDYNLTRGENYTVFEMSDNNRVWRFGTLICYEDTDAEVTRKMVVDDNGSKKVDWLVNISNDGWYTRYTEKGDFPSGELSQRTAITVFRAVENRIGIVRSVNAGVSCIIDPTGKIRDGFLFGSLPREPMARQAVAGWFVDRMNVDKRTTMFSVHGKWLDKICAWQIVIVIVLVIISGAKKKSKGES